MPQAELPDDDDYTKETEDAGENVEQTNEDEPRVNDEDAGENVELPDYDDSNVNDENTGDDAESFSADSDDRPVAKGLFTFHGDLVFAWLLYIAALSLASFAVAIYIYSASTLLPSKYIPTTLDIPCMSAFLLLAIILLALGRSIELTGADDHLLPRSRGITDKIKRLKESNIYDRVRLNKLSEVDVYRRYRKRGKGKTSGSSIDPEGSMGSGEESSDDREKRKIS